MGNQSEDGYTSKPTHAQNSRKTIVSVCSESMKGVGRLHRPTRSPVTMFPRWMKGTQSWAAFQRQRGVFFVLCNYTIVLALYSYLN